MVGRRSYRQSEVAADIKQARGGGHGKERAAADYISGRKGEAPQPLEFAFGASVCGPEVVAETVPWATDCVPPALPGLPRRGNVQAVRRQNL